MTPTEVAPRTLPDVVGGESPDTAIGTPSNPSIAKGAPSSEIGLTAEQRRRQQSSAIFAGASLGGLLGVLMGLAVTPVVGSVVGGLVVLLGLFLALRDDAPADGAASASRSTLSSDARRYGIGSFAFFALLGVLSGNVLRARGLLDLSPEQRIQRWTAAKYDSADARAIVALEAVGIVPRGFRVQGRPTGDRSAASVIFSADAADCDRLDPRDRATARELVTAFKAASRGWADFASALDGVPNEHTKLALLGAAWRLVCRG
jgi:hypothetical protein